MAISPFKIFIAGEILTAADLNSSFTTITGAGLSLVFPATASVDFDGQSLVLDSDGDTSITASADDQIDFELSSIDHFRMLLDGGVPDFRAISADAGAAVEPYISLVRDSASPAADDILGRLRWIGDDDGGNETVYAALEGQISDATDASEDGRLRILLPVGGTLAHVGQFGAGYRFQVRSDDDGAGPSPTLDLLNSTASAADADALANIEFNGKDSAQNTTVYAEIRAVSDDVTDTTEDGALIISVQKAGTLTNMLEIDAFGIHIEGTQIHALADGLAAAQASTSGTTVDFTNIRSDARRITINFVGVSTDGVEELLVQIGDSGGLEITGYTSASGNLEAGSGNLGTSSTGFQVTAGTDLATDAYNGSVVLTLADASTNTWISNGTLILTTRICASAGAKSLSAVLDRLTITTTGTPDDFDAGSISIMVE